MLLVSKRPVVLLVLTTTCIAGIEQCCVAGVKGLLCSLR